VTASIKLSSVDIWLSHQETSQMSISRDSFNYFTQTIKNTIFSWVIPQSELLYNSKHIILSVNWQVTWLVITEVRSASFRLVLQFANSVNFLVTWGLPVTIFHSTCILCVYGMTVYWPTVQFYVCMYVSFVCRYVVPPGECYYNTLLRCDYFSSSTRFLCAMSVFDVQASSSSPRLPLCLISLILQPPLLS